MLNKYIPSRVHYIQGNFLWGSLGSSIMVSLNGGISWETIASLPVNIFSLTKLLTSNSLSRRLGRLGVHHILPIPDHLVIFYNNKIYRFSTKTKTWGEQPSRIIGSRPLCICITPNHYIYYGEYRDNKERSPISIYGSFDGGISWSKVYTFTGIRHIHGIFYDNYSNNDLWITTGDDDFESSIWRSSDGFRTVDKVIGGGQQTRAIQLVFSRDFIYFGTDTPLSQNYIYRLGRNSFKIERLQKLNGSVFWGCRAGKYILFSTSVEPSPINKNKYATLYASEDGTHWHDLISFKKDFLPHKLFQYGQILLPQGENQTGFIWFTPYATHKDQKLQSISLSEFL